MTKNGITRLALLVFCLLGAIFLNAQKAEPPIPAELFLGNENHNFQLVVKKKFSQSSRFNFFSVATFTADYENDLGVNRILMPVQVSYDLGKGFGIMAVGLQFRGWILPCSGSAI